jgi:hypothetical protein
VGNSIRFEITQGSGSLVDEWGNTGAKLVIPTKNGTAQCSWKLDEKTRAQQVKAVLLNNNQPSTLQPVFFNATLVSQISAANAGLIVITERQGVTLYGPFWHYLTNLVAPPAVVLGIEQIKDERYQVVSHMEDEGLYPFGKGELLFKPELVDLTSFSIRLVNPNPVERPIHHIRWWAIPSQEQKIQASPDKPSITLSPNTGPKGTLVSIIGAGYVANADVLITSDKRRQNTSTNEYGSFTVEYKTPLNWEVGSKHTFSAKDTSENKATAVFLVVPLAILDRPVKSKRLQSTSTR